MPNRTQEQSYPDNKLHVLRSFNRRWEESGRVPFDRAAVVGKNPFNRGKMQSYLWDLGVEAKYLREISRPEVLVLGRSWVEDQEEHEVRRLLSQRRGQKLRICSQEMLLAWSMTGTDPNRRPQTAEPFVEGHPALEMIRAEMEGRWPGTDPLPSPGSGTGDGEYGPDESPLSRLGYSTGKTGKGRSERRKILRRAYRMALGDFPGDYPEEYIQEWGPAESGKRLKRIADHLAANCRNFKSNRGGDYSTAIDQWEQDLKWLKQRYYVSTTYGFRWPSPSAS